MIAGTTTIPKDDQGPAAPGFRAVAGAVAIRVAVAAGLVVGGSCVIWPRIVGRTISFFTTATFFTTAGLVAAGLLAVLIAGRIVNCLTQDGSQHFAAATHRRIGKSLPSF
jgi:hypothetical protein